MTKRLFIAINLEEPIKQQINRIIQDLKKKNQRVNIKWVKTENLHLTLHFLGSVEENMIASIKNIISEISNELSMISYWLSEINGFPDLYKPRVIFIALKSQKLAQLVGCQRDLGRKLANLGLSIDKRPWQAHITLGRVKEVNCPRLILSSKIGPLEGQIRAMDLMESKLTSTGPIYSKLASFSLNKN